MRRRMYSLDSAVNSLNGLYIIERCSRLGKCNKLSAGSSVSRLFASDKYRMSCKFYMKNKLFLPVIFFFCLEILI